MDQRDTARRYLVERFQREGVVTGTPESLAQEAGCTTRAMEEALACLIDEHRIRPFQDDEGTLEYQWGDYLS
jgi:hypothetical protein